MSSVEYYNNNAAAFIDRTFDLDMSHLTEAFLEYIPEGGRILDLGCGSGRDAIKLKELGYDVYAVDASKKMVEHASKFLGDRVTLSTFQAFETPMSFDGIWASASLLHVPEDEMIEVIRKYRDMLKSGGIFHMSFKQYGTHFTHEDRSFTCYDEDGLRAMVRRAGEMVELELHTSESVMTSPSQLKWVNGVFRRKPIEYWDVLDRNRHKTGKLAIRGNRLEEGEFHLVVFGIIRNSNGKFIISKRAPEKTFAGSWEVTGGAAIKGDTSRQAILREVREELGVQLTTEGRLLMSKTYQGGHSYFVDIWYFQEDVDMTEVVCQPGEVVEAKLATYDEIVELHKQGKFMSGHKEIMACIKEEKL